MEVREQLLELELSSIRFAGHHMRYLCNGNGIVSVFGFEGVPVSRLH